MKRRGTPLRRLLGVVLAGSSALACGACRKTDERGPHSPGPVELRPSIAAPRASAESLGLEPLRIAYPSEGLVVDAPVAPHARFPLRRGVMVDDPGAQPGARYLAVMPEGVVGELELTAETCPPASDGSGVSCGECRTWRPRFAGWIAGPTLPLDELDSDMVLVGASDAGTREALRAGQPRSCVADEFPAPWVCLLAVDLDRDGHDDLSAVYKSCEEHELRAGGSRCAALEVWRRHEGRWWATDWQDGRPDPSSPTPLRQDELDLFSVHMTPGASPGAERVPGLRHAMFSERPAIAGAVYVLIDHAGPVALVQAGPAPADGHATQTAVFTRAPAREVGPSSFAVGPVHADWEYLRRARAHGEFLERKPAGPTPAGERRVALAVDLDADGAAELELVVREGLELTGASQLPLQTRELWVGSGDRRHLRERAVQWTGLRHATRDVWCGLEPDDPR